MTGFSGKLRASLTRRLLRLLAVSALLVAGIVGLLNIENPDHDARTIAFMGLLLIAV